MMDTLLADLRYALRTLRKSPGFATAAILTLALAIGSNTAIFSVVSGVLFRPLPFAEQDRLFMLGEQSRQGGFRPPSYPTFLDWQAQSSAFVDLAYVRGAGQRLTGSEGVQSVIVSVVSPGFFATLGEHPLMGRLFTPDEERAGAHVAVLSYGLWRGRFGGDPHILGTTLSLSSGVSTVVGVLPHDVAYPPWADEQLYMPIATVAATERVLTQRGFHADCRIIGRLKPGVTAEQAKTALDAVARREAAAYPEFNADWISVRQFPLRDEILGETTPRQLLVLLVAVGLVLMIGCVNVANLTLARAGARGRELAIRSALGAGRGRVVRQLLTESLVLASVGAALGVVTAHGAIALLKRAAPGVLPRIETVRVDGWVLAFALGVTVITAVAVGLLPALRAARPDLTDSLKEGTARAGTGHGRQRLRGALVMSEIALAVVLVVGAGLLIRSLWRLRAVNPGFDPAGLVSFYISPPPLRAQDPARLTALYTQVQDAARALPGVTSVALTNFTPLSGGGLPSPVEIPGRAPDAERDPRVWFMTVSPGYVRTMRIPLRAGREFTEADLSGGPAVIVNEAFARAFWRGLDPIDLIGRQVTLHKAVQGRPDFGEPLPGTVVGVVGDVHHFGLDLPAEAQVYVPFTRTVWGHMSLVVRTAVLPAGFLATLSRAVRQVDPDIPMTLSDGRSAADTIDISAGLESRQLDTWLLGSFAAAALLLAAIGIYGLLAYAVGQRRRELGIRLALGASRGDVMSQVVGDGIRLAAAGIGVGVLIALAVSRLLGALLYEVGTSDPATFVGVVALLAVVSLVASYLPARRAAQVDPMVALRYE